MTSRFWKTSKASRRQTTNYPAYDRIATRAATHPTRFAVKNVYNPQGYLAEVRNAANDANDALYWQANIKDAEGHLLNQTLGNALTTSQTFDPNTGRVQSIFTGGVQNVSYLFDAAGNLQNRSDSMQSLIEDFTFDQLNRLKTYNKNGVRPHAVATVTGPSATLNYTYDANGNMLTGAGRTVTWNSFNMAYQVTQGANTLTYVYDADHTRIKETGPGGTTIYINPRLDLGGHFEKTTKPDGSVEYKHYLYAGGQSIGVYTSRSTGVSDTRYFHTDHLGSISVITDEAGAVVARYSYDPFGNRTTVAGDATVTHHGFTGHEHMEEVGLINMNGRVYDPALARFMSADPNVQAPGNGQSFNRYSYVLNNPLSYTDPSGYFVHKKIARAWRSVWRSEVGRIAVSVGVGMLTGGFAAGLTWGNEVVAGMAGGFSGSFVGSGGNFKTGLIGGVTGGVAGNISSVYGDTWNWQRVGANSVAGGVGSTLQGGKFEDGFKTSFATSALTYANYSMRQEMVAQSSFNPDNINGESDGFFQDGKKLAGSRRTIGFDGGYLTCDSLMGGCQGAPIRPGDVRSSFFGMEYGSGSLPDRANEAWAGPHDWLRNATGSYDSLGNAVNFTGFRAVADSVMNYALVIPATPLAVSALITTTPGGLAILCQIK